MPAPRSIAENPPSSPDHPAAPNDRDPSFGTAPRTALALALVIWVGLLIARATAPSDLMVRDQERVAAYVLDIVQNGHVLLQHDVHGNVASKPPIFNWLAALTSALGGGVSRVSLGLPSALACLGGMLLLLRLAARYFGQGAALWVVPLFAFSTLGLRQVFLVRSDAVFAFFTCLTAVAVWRAWQRGGGWIWVGLAGGAAAMTKGPHGVLFAMAGLAAVWWERRSGHPLPLRGRVWPAVVTFLAIPLCWVFGAWLEGGKPVLDKLFLDELVGHALGVRQGEPSAPGHKFGHPWAWFFTRMAPVSLVAVLGIWRTAKHPATGEAERRFERFLTCWLLGGLLVLSLQSTVRFIHLLPMMPPAALLASREVAAWLHRTTPHRTFGIAWATAATALGFSFVYLHVLDAKNPEVAVSERVRQAADDIARRYDVRRLEFVDAPVALQVHLNVFRPVLDPEAAKARLAGRAPVLLAILAESGHATVDAPQVYGRYPLNDRSELRIVGNAPTPPADPR
ncbi:MAG: glycosyltransferase family 39 protein [Planctomycetes bacterium]|nr:glycosyltransferase family 39 protein [Planctomycetota bacterium]